MKRISIQIDSPAYIKVSEIGNDLLAFASIIETKYKQIDFEFAFCFRVLYTIKGINSKVRFHKDENWLGMDLIMSLDEFNPYKTNVLMQRLIMGKHFFPFFTENIEKYKSKLPSLKPVSENLIEDMKLFLKDNLWLKDDENNLKLSIVKTVSYQRAMELFGNFVQKSFSETEQGEKEQTVIWQIEEDNKLSAKYTLTGKKWELKSYSII